MSNPNKIPWGYYQDIQVNDKAIRDKFDSLIKAEDYAGAIKLLNQSKVALKDKIYCADAIKRIANGVKVLQADFYTNAIEFLADLAEENNTKVETYCNKGEWAASAVYKPLNIVFYQDEAYIAIADIVNAEVPGVSPLWFKIGLKGEQGAPGVDLEMEKYEWSPKQIYLKHEVVPYKDNLYVSLRGSKGAVPDESPADWLLFISIDKGEITVGTTPPTKVAQNSIWIKTSADPNSNAVVNGTFYRYTKTGTWEIMLPNVLFQMVEGHEEYAQSKKFDSITILPEQWEGTSYYTYNNKFITETSIVSVEPASSLSYEQRVVYDSLSADAYNGQLVLKYAKEIGLVTVPLELNITIQ